jgi:hypothetical protein
LPEHNTRVKNENRRPNIKHMIYEKEARANTRFLFRNHVK